MTFKLKPRKYGTIDFIRIPFQCEPMGTILLAFQKFLTAMAAIYQIVATAKFIDYAIKSAKTGVISKDVFLWLLVLMLCVGWRRVSFNIGQVFTKKVQINANKVLSQEFTDKKARLKFSLIENPETWDIINRVCNSIERNIYEMLQSTYNLILYLIRIFGVLIIIYSQVKWISILIGLLSIPLIIMSARGGSKIYVAQKNSSQYERRHKYLAEVLSSREAVNERALFGFTDSVNKKWYEQFETARKIRMKAEIRYSLSSRGGSAVNCIVSTALLLLFIKPAVSGQLTLGMFIAIAGGIYELVSLIGKDFTRMASRLSRQYEYLKDMTLFANLEETEGATDLKTDSPMTVDTLEFRNVSFKYPGTEKYILKNLSLKFENGVHYAFVGVNGAGKTTITKLITGLYDNYEGDILVNSRELRNFSQSEIKAMFSGIYQDFARYSVTVGQNIMLGDIRNLDTDEAKSKMKEIAKALGINDVIEAFPKGYDTYLGKIEKDGVDFSGGQWQRIAMARALMSTASLLILDEPTAALDPISESQLYEQFEAISKGRTTIFISHRLGSTKIADKIFVMDNGSIAEEGSHQELMDKQGIYFRMYDSQRSWYE